MPIYYSCGHTSTGSHDSGFDPNSTYRPYVCNRCRERQPIPTAPQGDPRRAPASSNVRPVEPSVYVGPTSYAFPSSGTWAQVYNPYQATAGPPQASAAGGVANAAAQVAPPGPVGYANVPQTQPASSSVPQRQINGILPASTAAGAPATTTSSAPASNPAWTSVPRYPWT